MTRFRVAGTLRQLVRVLPPLTLLILLAVVSQAQSSVEPTRSPADPAAAPTNAAKPPADATPPAADPTNSDPNKSAAGLQTRIGRARALIAAHRLDIAGGELESVRSAARDSMIRNIASIMLMSVYLEDGNYTRAEALLEETYQGRAAQKDESLGTYFALAGQAVNGARAHLTRYRSFGVHTSDENLPVEAVNDLNRLRSLLERMIAQAKEISRERRAYDSLSLLEDVLGIRLSLAEDEVDQAKWEIEYAGARQALASSQTQIAALGGVPPLRPAQLPVSKATGPSPYSTKKVGESPLQIKAPEKKDENVAEQPATDSAAPAQSSTPASKTDDSKSQTSGTKPSQLPVNDVGSLNEAATKRVLPRYPTLAKQTGAAGLVRVYVIVDETGKVVSISRSEGPVLLRQAAEDAARQWSFQTTPTDGQPLRLKGYIDFNFSL